jgi:hypothetical protein
MMPIRLAIHYPILPAAAAGRLMTYVLMKKWMKKTKSVSEARSAVLGRKDKSGGGTNAESNVSHPNKGRLALTSLALTSPTHQT